jgi:hypothetical protein
MDATTAKRGRSFEPLLPSAPIVAKLARAFIDGAAEIPTDRELALLNMWIEAEFRAIPVPVRFTAADVDLPRCSPHCAALAIC